MISKTNQTTGEFTSYTYNLENRLASAEIQRVETDQSGDPHNVSISTAYTYNQSGIRITAESTTSVDGGTGFDTLRTFLVDPRNHTGYAQVLEEFRDAAPTPIKTYTIGNDVVSDSGQFLLYDGHGSTRLLTDTDGEITHRLSYDAYGNMLEKQPGALTPPATDLTYAGEQFDPLLQMGYNRARYCSPATGTWNRLDPYEGNQFDPQSLHEYAYCRRNPTNNSDPSGLFTLTEILSVTSTVFLLTFSYSTIILNNRTSDALIDAFIITGITLLGMLAFNFSIALGSQAGIHDIAFSIPIQNMGQAQLLMRGMYRVAYVIVAWGIMPFVSASMRQLEAVIMRHPDTYIAFLEELHGYVSANPTMPNPIEVAIDWFSDLIEDVIKQKDN